MNAAGLAAVLIALVKTFVVLAVTMGWVDWSDAQQAALMGFTVALVDVAIILATSWYSRRLVTPTSDPRDKDGAKLVRAYD